MCDESIRNHAKRINRGDDFDVCQCCGREDPNAVSVICQVCGEVHCSGCGNFCPLGNEFLCNDCAVLECMVCPYTDICEMGGL